jgi:carbon storage regulator
MLVLSRKKNEDLVIGIGPEAVIIRVNEIRDDKVRLGITAPASVPVHRLEIYKAMVRDGKLPPLEGGGN